MHLLWRMHYRACRIEPCRGNCDGHSQTPTGDWVCPGCRKRKQNDKAREKREQKREERREQKQREREEAEANAPARKTVRRRCFARKEDGLCFAHPAPRSRCHKTFHSSLFQQQIRSCVASFLNSFFSVFLWHVSCLIGTTYHPV